MTVDCALERWYMLESLGIPTISPSCAHPSGEWMKSFMAEVDSSGKRVDWVGVHWYGGPNFSNFQRCMTDFYKSYNRPDATRQRSLSPPVEPFETRRF